MSLNLIKDDNELFPLWVFYTIFGTTAVIAGLTPVVLKEYVWLNEVMLSTGVGILFGATGVIPAPANWAVFFPFLQEVTRVFLAIQLVTSALELPRKYFKDSWLSVLILVLPVLTLTWITSTFTIYAFFHDQFGLWESFLLGAAVTPTDPVLSGAILRGKIAETCIPANIRDLIYAESGANDGAAFPFVMLPIVFLTKNNGSVGHKIYEYFVEVLLYEVLLAIIIAIVVGFILGVMFVWSDKKQYVEDDSYYAGRAAIAFLIMGVTLLLGQDEILSAFVGGVAFGWRESRAVHRQEIITLNVIVFLLTIAFFIFFGIILPYQRWLDLGIGRLIGCVAVLFLTSRIPFVLLFKQQLEEAVYVGWFGPVGVAAIYYSALAFLELEDRLYFDFLSFVVFASVIVHGITASPFSLLLQKTSKPEQAKKAQEMHDKREKV